MDIDLLVELKQQRSKGLLTVSGYLLEACTILEVDIATVDRQWLARQAEMTPKAVQSAIDRLRAKGLI
jgi:DNA-binding MarR family transcriptional regulator